MTTLHNFTLKKKPVELQECYYVLVFLTNCTYLEPRQLVIFGFQLHPINYENCRGS